MQAVIVKQIPHDSNFHHVYQLDQGNEIDVIYFKFYYYFFFSEYFKSYYIFKGVTSISLSCCHIPQPDVCLTQIEHSL